jgi:hypothetical protein
VTLGSRCLAPQLSLNCPAVAPYSSSTVSEHSSATGPLTVRPPEGQDRQQELQSGEAERRGNDPFNTYIVRTYKSGKQAYARLDRAHGLSGKAISSEKVVTLSDAEASEISATSWRPLVSARC